MDKIETLLKELTEANGIPGHETEVRKLMRHHLESVGEVSHDKLGSLICRKPGDTVEPKVMLAAHMDEIGFIVSNITNQGFVKFTPSGGWWDHVLLAQRVVIETASGQVVGMIGAKPPHLLSDEERAKLLNNKDMYIDIGATSGEEVEKAGVRIADPVVPIGGFTILANGKTYLSKAFDDRVGCALAVTVMNRFSKDSHPNTLFAVATVQEEVGLRGARTGVEVADPDVAIVLEGTGATDVPGISGDRDAALGIGKGPIVTLYRQDMIPNLKLRNLLVDTATQHGIPLQIRANGIRGGTDGAVIHLHRSGVPTVVLSLPVRHIHSHGGIMHRDDFDGAVELLVRVLQKLDQKTVYDLTSW
jgi:endoglucanase